MKPTLSKLKSVLGEGVIENEPLSRHTTLGIGGPARYFYRAKTISDLILAVQTALKLKIPYIVLGNGSNVVVSDKGFFGLCIKNETQNLSFIKDKAQVLADSGVPLSRLIIESASYDLGGLEFLYGIPGTVGGAIVSNAGTFGGAIGDFVISATLLFPNGSIKRVTKKWLFFGYRDSKILHLKPRPIILSVKFQLSTNRKEEILRKIQHFQKIRAIKHPLEKSAGSYFKNPKADKIWAKKYLDMRGEKDMEIWEQLSKTGHIPAGWLLEQAGAKKIRVKAARVSKKHANFIINYKGRAKASQVRELAALLKQKVHEKFGIILEEEVEYVGEW
jgi:UDP-N-acetylmuramate dehydrogenase